MTLQALRECAEPKADETELFLVPLCGVKTCKFILKGFKKSWMGE